MNFDKEKILFMEKNLSKLKKLRDLDREVFIEDFRNVDSAKYLLQVSI